MPPEFLQGHFAGCTIEQARELLVKSGFAAEELGPEFDDGAPIVPRRMMAEKTIRPIGQMARSTAGSSCEQTGRMD